MTDFLIPVVTGATASGKTELVLSAAQKNTKIEIINADAFQIYRGLDIGTAKPSLEIRNKHTHHLVDIIEPCRNYNTGAFKNDAEKAIDDILLRGHIPVVVGGTGLYITSLIDGLFNSPEIDESLRTNLRERAFSQGSQKLHKELLAIDPVTANKLHPNDSVRIVRALEVWHTLKIPISKAHIDFHVKPKYKYKVYVLDSAKKDLYKKIDARVGKMLTNGWLNEVEGLMSIGINKKMPSFKAIGYRELYDVLTGELSIAEAELMIAQKTRNYAKRQQTWFRGMQDVLFTDGKTIIEDLCKLER